MGRRILGWMVRPLGENHATTHTKKQAAEYESLLNQGYSVNLYLLWGGTSFGWMRGANKHGKDDQPDVM